MIHQTDLVVGVGIPRPVNLYRSGGLPAGGVAQIGCDAAILSLEFLNGVEGRVAGEEGYGGVQSPSGKQHQREARPSLLIIVDTNRAFLVELASAAVTRLLSKCVWQSGRCRCRSPSCQYGSSGYTHSRRPP